MREPIGEAEEEEEVSTDEKESSEEEESSDESVISENNNKKNPARKRGNIRAGEARRTNHQCVICYLLTAQLSVACLPLYYRRKIM